MTLLVKQCLLLCIFVFSSNNRLFNISRIFSEQAEPCFFRFSLIFPSNALQSPQPASLKLTFLHSQWIRNLNALACLPENVYLCIGNGQKGSISRMSDECLMTLEFGIPFYIVYQAVMRKFTLAGKSQ